MRAKGISKQTLFIVVVFGALVFWAIALTKQKRPIDWSLSFSKKDTKPFGNKVLFELLPQVFSTDPIATVHSAFYDYFLDNNEEDQNIIFVTEKFEPDGASLNQLFRIVSQGNSVFVSAHHFSEAFLDSVEVALNHEKSFMMQMTDSVHLNFTNRRFKTANGFWYKQALNAVYINSYDTATVSVLGYSQSQFTNYIKIPKGDGAIFLHTDPLMFTNYNLLKRDNYEYIFKCFSYLPNQKTFWDESYKATPRIIKSQLGFILKNESLRYAWYLFLGTILLLFVFESKRKQRVIPVVVKPENTSMKFVESISRLYYSRQNHLDIANKRIRFLLDFLRQRYYVDTSVISDALVEEIIEKSGINERSVIALFKTIQRISKSRVLTEMELESLNNKIEYFYRNCQ